jgi:hypothetical protein
MSRGSSTTAGNHLLDKFGHLTFAGLKIYAELFKQTAFMTAIVSAKTAAHNWLRSPPVCP